MATEIFGKVVLKHAGQQYRPLSSCDFPEPMEYQRRNLTAAENIPQQGTRLSDPCNSPLTIAVCHRRSVTISANHPPCIPSHWAWGKPSLDAQTPNHAVHMVPHTENVLHPIGLWITLTCVSLPATLQRAPQLRILLHLVASDSAMDRRCNVQNK